MELLKCNVAITPPPKKEKKKPTQVGEIIMEIINQILRQILFIYSIDLKMQPASDAWHLTNSSIPTGCLLSKQS